MADYNASSYGLLGAKGGSGNKQQPSTPYDVGYGAGFGSTGPGGKSSITLGGGSNDWASQILNDPAFQALKNSLSAQGISDAAHLRGAIQQLLIQFGGVPNLPTDVLETTGLDTAGTQQLADQNPFSMLKRLAQNYQDQQDATKNQLAARGILSSGETGFQLGKLGQQNAQGTYDATSGLLGSIGTLNDQYVAGREAAANQLAQGAQQAESNAAANGAGAGGPSVTATWDPATGTYKDPSGNYYDANGNPVTLPSNSQAPSLPTSTPGTPPTYDPTKLFTPVGVGGVNAFG